MRVVVALPAPPASQGGAADRCAIGLLDGVRTHGVDVDAIAPDLGGASWPAEAAQLGVQRVPVHPPTGLRGRLGHLTRPLGDLSRTSLQREVRELTSDADVLHLERSMTAWLDMGVQVPVVMSLHYRARLDRSVGMPWRAAGREELLFRALERRAILRYTWFVATSARVAEEIRSDRRRANVTVVPLSLDPAAYPAVVRADPDPVAGMIGTAAWPPTADAFRRLHKIWPAIRAGVPAARLRLAGRGLAARAADAETGVEVLGEVSTTQEFLGGLRVLLYPVMRGSGMKVKVLEAIASGLPVITTTAGAEGFDASDGIVVADDERAFVAAAVDVLRDVDERRARANAARLHFESRYAPEPATAPLVELYERICR